MYSDMSSRTMRPLVVEQELGQRPGGLGLSHAGRAQEDERAERAVRVLQPGAAPPHRVGHRGHRRRLADHPPAQLLLQPGQPLALRLQHLGHRNSGPLGHDLGDVLGVHLLLQVHGAVAWISCSRRSSSASRRSSSGSSAIAQLGGPLEIAAPGGLLDLPPHLLDLRLELLDLLERGLLRLPLRLHAVSFLPQRRDLPLQRLAPLHRCLVLLLEQRLALDLQLDDAPLHLVDFLRQAVDLDPEPAGRLVDQVDGLVRQEPVADVAVGQRGRGDDGVVGDPDAVVDLVLLLEARAEWRWCPPPWARPP